MTQRELLDEFSALPVEAQKEVVEFLGYLRQKYQSASSSAKKIADPMGEKFIGMWGQREDLADSTSWVRQLRTKEWSKAHG